PLGLSRRDRENSIFLSHERLSWDTEFMKHFRNLISEPGFHGKIALAFQYDFGLFLLRPSHSGRGHYGDVLRLSQGKVAEPWRKFQDESRKTSAGIGCDGNPLDC